MTARSRKTKLGMHSNNPRRHSSTDYTGARRATRQNHSTTVRRVHAKRRRH